jgi:hypothetical protein
MFRTVLLVTDHKRCVAQVAKNKNVNIKFNVHDAFLEKPS